MQIPLLKDSEVQPTDSVLEEAFGPVYPVYKAFMDAITSDEFGLNPEWRFYNDGKAWLCKITHKKKTIVWLSAWEDCFKLGFYFTEKTGAGIPDLDINETIKEFYLNHEPIGKLKPVVIDAREASQLDDIKTLVRYKIDQR